MQLLQSERISLFAASMRLGFLIFEAMRSHLKFQLEVRMVYIQEWKFGFWTNVTSDEIFNDKWDCVISEANIIIIIYYPPEQIMM